jgi:hypothetical protein
MRSWNTGRRHHIALFIIITGLSFFTFVINAAETELNATSTTKGYPRQAVAKNAYKSSRLRLASGAFDPIFQTQPDKHPARISANNAAEENARYWIVQFDGPITDGYKYALEELGIEVLDYLPEFAFIVTMDAEKRTSVRALRGVRWVGAYQPAYKFKRKKTRALSLDARSYEVADYLVTLFKTSNFAAIAARIEMQGAEILDISEHGSRPKLKIRISPQALASVAAINGVKWIEAAPVWELTNNVASAIMTTREAWNTHNLYGAGQRIAVADTGLDQGSRLPADLHDDFEDGNGASRVAKIFDRVGDGGDDVNTGHGTHVAGSIVGNGALSGSDPAVHDYDHPDAYIGIAPEATLVFQAVENNSSEELSGIPSDLSDLFQQAYDEGSRIHTNSWGSSEAGNYTSYSQDVDEFVWNNKDFLILFSVGNDGVDADGDGVVDLSSVGSPATAKNCISVGASENYRPNGSSPAPAITESYGAKWPTAYPVDPLNSDLMSDDENGMVAFSSRGPCLDGRIKPDIVAPGTNIVSTKSSATTATLWGQGPDLDGTNYTYSGGTSMATPLTAGAAALVREFYIDRQGISPSAALIKATLLNGAFDTRPGQYGTGSTQEIPDAPRPNNVQGWGRVDLENSIFPPITRILTFEDETGGLTTNESDVYEFTMIDGSEPLNATLVWSDYPGSPAAGGGLVNDLDFSIIDPSGNVFYPNNASQGEATEVISYDDGIVDGAYQWSDGFRVGVRFTPPTYPARLSEAVFLLSSESYPSTFSYYVYGGSASSGPQELLASGTTTIYGYGWHTVDLTSPVLEVTGGDFFLVIELTDELIWYYDSRTPGGRSWDYADETWSRWLNENYMFRAVVFSPDAITSYDRINNIVGIDIENPVDGKYNLYIEGYNIPQSLQPYALVLSSGEVLNWTKILPPISPKAVSAHALTSGRIDLSWTDRSDNEDGFKIEKKIGPSGTYSQIGTVVADITEYTDTDLNDETKYYYRVYAYSGELRSSFYNETTVVTHAPPTDLIATAVSASAVSLSWEDNSALESGYEIWRKIPEDENYSLVTTVAADETTHTDNKLAASTVYEYVIRAISTNSGSDFSNQASATTQSKSGGGGGCFIRVAQE